MSNESFMAWGDRIRRELGATFKIFGSVGVFVSRTGGMSASGKPLTPIAVTLEGATSVFGCARWWHAASGVSASAASRRGRDGRNIGYSCNEAVGRTGGAVQAGAEGRKLRCGARIRVRPVCGPCAARVRIVSHLK